MCIHRLDHQILHIWGMPYAHRAVCHRIAMLISMVSPSYGKKVKPAYLIFLNLIICPVWENKFCCYYLTKFACFYFGNTSTLNFMLKFSFTTWICRAYLLSSEILFHLVSLWMSVQGPRMEFQIFTLEDLNLIPAGLQICFLQICIIRLLFQSNSTSVCIWIAISEKFSPVLKVNPSRQTPIIGECNIARYLARLLSPSYDSKAAVTSTQIDALIDLADGRLSNDAIQTGNFLKTVSDHLGKSQWVLGESLTVADIVLWSALHQSKLVGKAPDNVKRWIDTCNHHPDFAIVRQLV